MAIDKEKRFVLFKKIAKHGNQAVIVVPKVLSKRLKPGILTKLTIDILEEDEK